MALLRILLLCTFHILENTAKLAGTKQYVLFATSPAEYLFHIDYFSEFQFLLPHERAQDRSALRVLTRTNQTNSAPSPTDEKLRRRETNAGDTPKPYTVGGWSYIKAAA